MFELENNKELISIIIPTHNRAELLVRALNSVKNQSYTSKEIIVVDDGSVDNTSEIVTQMQVVTENLHYFKLNPSKGAPAARNYGIRQARGKYVALLDDDDEMLPERLTKLMQNYSDDYAYLFSGFYIKAKTSTKKIIFKRNISLSDMLYKNYAGMGGQILTLKERLIDINGFDENLMAAQDYDIAIRLNEKYGNALSIQEPLSIIHVDHGKNRISKSEGKFHGAFSFYLKHKSKMTKKQRKYRLFILKYKIQGKQRTLSRILQMVPCRFIWRELKILIIDH